MTIEVLLVLTSRHDDLQFYMRVWGHWDLTTKGKEYPERKAEKVHRAGTSIFLSSGSVLQQYEFKLLGDSTLHTTQKLKIRGG